MPQQRITFDLGETHLSPVVSKALNLTGETILPYLTRYSHQDWGDLSQGEAEVNNEALRTGGCLIATYTLRDNQTRIWIGTNDSYTDTYIVGDDEHTLE